MKRVVLIGILLAVILAACGGGAPAPLTGTTWTLTSMYQATLLPDAKITAVFDSNGQLSGTGGCNNYSAGYEISGSNLTVSSPNSTVMSCTEPVDKQESAYFYLLEASGAYEIKGSELTIKDGTGETILKYNATN